MEQNQDLSAKQNKKEGKADDSKPNPPPLTFMRFSGLAFEMLAFILLGVWLGHTLDVYFEFVFPLFTLSLSMAGLAGGIFYLIKKLP